MICPFTTAGSVMSVVTVAGSGPGSPCLAVPGRVPAPARRIREAGPRRTGADSICPAAFRTRISRRPGSASAGQRTSQRSRFRRLPGGSACTSLAALIAGDLPLDLGDFLAGFGVGLAFAELVAFSRNTLTSFSVMVLMSVDHLGFDAAAGEVHAADVRFQRDLPAQRDQKRRALPAAGRIDVADRGRSCLRGKGTSDYQRTGVESQKRFMAELTPIV